MNKAGREVLLLAHGSKSPDYSAACEVFLDGWEQYSGMHSRLGFLEQCEPLLEDVLAEASSRSRMLIVLPLLLNAGKHLRQDIPDRLAGFKQQHPETELHLANGLTDVGVVAETLYDRITGIQADVQSIILLTHGSRQSGVQQHIMQLADTLAERAGTKVHIAFAGYGSPSLEAILAGQTGKETVAIVPHFLFPGGWMKQVCADMDTFRRAHSTTELVLAKYLGAHPLLLRLLLQQME
ncbi:MAG: sirohydrochlorin chelatase [Mariprofundaceae bacterium]|nr:sirohydrochlorin chelatase [Mariprofundaceae bacterium]